MAATIAHTALVLAVRSGRPRAPASEHVVPIESLVAVAPTEHPNDTAAMVSQQGAPERRERAARPSALPRAAGIHRTLAPPALPALRGGSEPILTDAIGTGAAFDRALAGSDRVD